MTDTDLRVLYNASCPVCRVEIDHYAATAAKQDLPLRFDDLNGPNLSLWGLSTDQAARRLHVLKDGKVLAGMDGFRAIWQALPRYRWLARVTGWPVIRPATEFAYDRLLAPVLYRAHLRRLRRAGQPARPSASR